MKDSNTPPLLVVWDLDETLFYCDDENDISEREPDFIYSDEDDEYRFFLREGAREIIAFLDGDPRFLQGVFTASGSDYANIAVNNIWPHLSKPEFILSSKNIIQRHSYSHSWNASGPGIMKDLEKVKRKGFSLGRTIAVDDKPEIYMRQYSNVLSVPAYTGNKNDENADLFTHLKSYLIILQNLDDIRPPEKRGWLQRMRNNNHDTSITFC